MHCSSREKFLFPFFFANSILHPFNLQNGSKFNIQIGVRHSKCKILTNQANHFLNTKFSSSFRLNEYVHSVRAKWKSWHLHCKTWQTVRELNKGLTHELQRYGKVNLIGFKSYGHVYAIPITSYNLWTWTELLDWHAIFLNANIKISYFSPFKANETRFEFRVHVDYFFIWKSEKCSHWNVEFLCQCQQCRFWTENDGRDKIQWNLFCFALFVDHFSKTKKIMHCFVFGETNVE